MKTQTLLILLILVFQGFLSIQLKKTEQNTTPPDKIQKLSRDIQQLQNSVEQLVLKDKLNKEKEIALPEGFPGANEIIANQSILQGNIKAIEAEIEFMSEQILEAQEAALTSYLGSQTFEDRLWEIALDFALNLSRPEIQDGLEKELEIFSPEQETAVQSKVRGNLQVIANAGMRYFSETGASQVDYSKLTGTYLDPVQPVGGESYSNVTVNASGGELLVTLSDGNQVILSY